MDDVPKYWYKHLDFFNSREEVNDSIMIPNIIIDQSDWLNRDQEHLFTWP